MGGLSVHFHHQTVMVLALRSGAIDGIGGGRYGSTAPQK
jgi:hypothetical protein